MRLQIDTAPAQDQLMEDLMQRAGLGSKKELFNNALTLFAWALDEVAKGRKIASVHEAEGHYRELQMPALMNAAREPTEVKRPVLKKMAY
jgi:hypothetical protein